MKNGVFSEYEVKEMGIKFSGTTSNTYKTANCVGSSEEEMETKKITKACRGETFWARARGTGNGTLSLSIHMPYDIYTEAYGMNLDSLIDGVKGYGRNSVHPSFSLVQHVYDEDGEEMFKAYPNCVLESGKASKIENGAEEVAEIELEISIQPDEFGQGMYQALASDLDETVKSKWMTAFEASMVQAATA